MGFDTEIPWKVSPVSTHTSAETNRALLLETLLKDVQTKNSLSGTDLMWNHEITIDIQDVLSQNQYGQVTGKLSFNGMITWTVLTGLRLISDNEARVEVDIVQVETKEDGSVIKVSKLSTAEMSVETEDFFNCSTCEDPEVLVPWSFLRNKGETGLDALVTITVTVPDGVFSGSNKSLATCPSNAQKILEAQVLTDVTIVTGSGTQIKAHKAFLSAESPVFLAMFENKMKESQENVVELKNMSEEGVKALLKYLYYGDFQDARESCVIALELFVAGNQYEIVALEKEMRNLFLEKSESWFDVDVAVRLFAFSRKLTPQDDVLKIKAVGALKLFADSLTNSKDLEELLEKDPAARIELLRLSLKA